MPSEGQAEKFRQVQEAFGIELRQHILSGKLREAKAVRGLMRHLARAHYRKLVNFEGFSFSTSEQEAVTFTAEEKDALKHLKTTRPYFYLPEGETIRSLQEIGPISIQVAGYKEYKEEDGSNRLLDRPARRIEVAVWANPDKPEEFFIPGSFGKTADQQDGIRKLEVEALTNKPGLGGVTIIRPEASEVLEVMSRHVRRTDIHLLGEAWQDKESGHFRMIRTNTPTTQSGSRLAEVTYFETHCFDDSLGVGDGDRGESDAHVGDAFWVVPNRAR